MDLLRTAVVDITTLVATSRALRTKRLDGDLAERRKLHDRLRGDLRRGTAAYIDTLARSKRGLVDHDLLSECRVAAEKQMQRATRYREALSRLMLNEPGVLADVAAARQDLWRLSHMAIQLRLGMAAMNDAGGREELEAARKPAARLRRRFRHALVAYARASHHEAKDRVIAAARAAALAEIGKRGLAEADHLCQIELRGDPAHAAIRIGVSKPLNDLVLDWRRPESD